MGDVQNWYLLKLNKLLHKRKIETRTEKISFEFRYIQNYRGCCYYCKYLIRSCMSFSVVSVCRSLGFESTSPHPIDGLID